MVETTLLQAAQPWQRSTSLSNPPLGNDEERVLRRGPVLGSVASLGQQRVVGPLRSDLLAWVQYSVRIERPS